MSRSFSHCTEVGCPNKVPASDGHSKCLLCLDDSHFLPRSELECSHCLAFKPKSYNRRLERRIDPRRPSDRQLTKDRRERASMRSAQSTIRHRSRSPDPSVRKPFRAHSITLGKDLKAPLPSTHHSSVVTFGAPLALPSSVSKTVYHTHHGPDHAVDNGPLSDPNRAVSVGPTSVSPDPGHAATMGLDTPGPDAQGTFHDAPVTGDVARTAPADGGAAHGAPAVQEVTQGARGAVDGARGAVDGAHGVGGAPHDALGVRGTSLHAPSAAGARGDAPVAHLSPVSKLLAHEGPPKDTRNTKAHSSLGDSSSEEEHSLRRRSRPPSLVDEENFVPDYNEVMDDAVQAFRTASWVKNAAASRTEMELQHAQAQVTLLRHKLSEDRATQSTAQPPAKRARVPSPVRFPAEASRTALPSKRGGQGCCLSQAPLSPVVQLHPLLGRRIQYSILRSSGCRIGCLTYLPRCTHLLSIWRTSLNRQRRVVSLQS